MAQTPAANLPVVLVDDDPTVLLSTRSLLRSAGIRNVHTLEDSRELMPFLQEKEAAVIVLDLFMPHLPGLQLLPLVVEAYPEIPVIVMTAAHEVETAVACMKDGAFDYLVKPVEESRFLSCLNKAMEMRALRQQVGALKRYLLSDRLEHGDAFAAIITKSRKMRALFQYMESIAGTCETILITGETGVGKELISEAVHRLSGRGGKLVSLNVAGLDDVMFSDTLFGHRKGAFTGAESPREGLITQAAGGTLFLDEIGDLGPGAQVKLLRLLQDHKYYPLGSDVPRASDACILCATNRNLPELMHQGRFRSDLYYRLGVHQIEVPPLRERREDIPALVGHYLEEAARSMDKSPPTPPPELFMLFDSYHFPGNIRELRSLIYDAVARHKSGILSTKTFRKVMTPKAGELPLGENLPVSGRSEELLTFPGRFPTLKESENVLIREALKRSNDNQGIAAGLLGISRQALNQRLRKKKTSPG
ncbi:MAG: sigma-54-dependent Fis family transcriptional regulator [Magnetococcales bacterium]|nr:sigma-54-dependent Fis family transcriptional regulator [Magnetococcales bacterium]